MVTRICRLLLLLTIVLMAATVAARTPDWLKEVARSSLPSYADDTDAVVLLEERVVTVSPSGEVRSTYRKAYKILRPGGRTHGTLYTYFDGQTEIPSLKGWGITASGEEYEVKKGDAVITGYSEELYSDTRYMVLQIPGAQPGSVVGYEYEQLERPFVLQALWPFQDEIPVRLARFTLELPTTWAYSATWRNHGIVSPQRTGDSRWSWELNNIDPIQSEKEMPTWNAVAGQFEISFAPKDPASQNNGSWAQIGRWYAQATKDRRDLTPAMRGKTQEIVRGINDPMERISALAAYVQHNIRYVAIEIGIGGYRPHPAQDVFTSGYGDCKDKATLLSAMLHEAGIDSYYLLINDKRDYVSAGFPSLLGFDHVILAIRLPDALNPGALAPVLHHEKFGRLLLFDPTDSSTPIGYLPTSLQSSRALLVTDNEGELIETPLSPPSANRLLRVAKLSLEKDGTLKGTIEEVRMGAFATALRESLLNSSANQRQTILQSMVTDMIDGAVLTGAGISPLHKFETSMTVKYELTVPGYAQRIGKLFLFRSCVLGHKGSSILEGKPRKEPLAFSYASSESDVVDISLPDSYAIDEIPKNVKYDYLFAEYRSETKATSRELNYARTYERKDVRIPLEKLNDLQKLYADIADDERGYAILRVSE